MLEAPWASGKEGEKNCERDAHYMHVYSKGCLTTVIWTWCDLINCHIDHSSLFDVSFTVRTDVSGVREGGSGAR